MDICKKCFHWSEPDPEELLPADEYGFCAVKNIIMFWDETCESFVDRNRVERADSTKLN